MIDLLTFVPDINTFRQALRDADSKFVAIDEKNEVKLLIGSLPVRTMGTRTLTLLRCTNAQKLFIESIPSVAIIGEHKGGNDYVFKPSGRIKYDQVYDGTAPMIGVFA